jgi:Peptidase inhibitor family I36
MRKGRIRELAVAAVAIASAVGLASLEGVSASAATTAHTAADAAVSVSAQASRYLPAETAGPDQAYDKCPRGYYCDYVGTRGSRYCFLTNRTDSSWQAAGCRNADESFANRTSGLVRLYYSPDLKGDWVCINPGAYSNNLAGYVFNNGPDKPGYGNGARLENNVASSSVGFGHCSNPLPWP